MHTLKTKFFYGRILKKLQNQRLLLYVFSFIFIGGILFLLSSHAASSFSSFEPESGTLSGSVQPVLNDQGASNNGSIKFSKAGGNTPVKIMPLGDSITYGVGSNSYRYPLTKLLKQGGYTNVDMVGTLKTFYNTGDTWDQDNEGHEGYNAETVMRNIGGWAATTKPDIVLIHLGTNIWYPNEDSVGEISSIIDILRGVNPRVKILLATIIPRADSGYEAHADFNAKISALVPQKNTIRSPVVLVDQFNGFDVNTDLRDGVHPNAQGDQKMANKWYAALVPLMP